jgi:hypothetical protein
MTLLCLYGYFRRGGMNRRQAAAKALQVFTRSY